MLPWAALKSLMPELESLLDRLIQGRVQFSVVGGFAAVAHGVTCITTLAAAQAAVEACRALRENELTVAPLQSRFVK